MASFDFVGRDSAGAQVKGQIEAANAGAVAEQLSRQQIIPLTIEPAKKKAGSVGDVGNIDISALLGGAPVSLDELIVFCRQMYALVRSGVPILRSINGMADSSSNPRLKEVLHQVASQLGRWLCFVFRVKSTSKVFFTAVCFIDPRGRKHWATRRCFCQTGFLL